MIVQRIDKSGHVLDTHVFSSNSIRLGRGYDNDLILTDPYVDPYHLTLTYDADNRRFVLTDLDSTNGVILEDNVSPPLQPGETVRLTSGDTVVVGKTRFRILNHNHWVPPAQRLSSWDPFYGVLGTWRAFVVLVGLALGLEVGVNYLSEPFTDSLFSNVVEALYLVLFALGYGLVWLMIARVQHHEGRFLLHTGMILAAFILVNLYLLAQPVIAFNLSGLMLGGHLATLLGCLGLFFVVYVSCYQSTGLSPLKRVSVSLLLPAVVVLGVAVAEMNRPDFQARPAYRMTLVPPAWQWRQAVPQAGFLEATDSVYRAPTEAALERRR